MIQNSNEKKYRINVVSNNVTLTYNECKIIKEDDTWVEFSDKFSKVYRYNKRNIVSMEELR